MVSYLLIIFGIYSLLCLFQNTNANSRIDPVVVTQLGLIKGLTATDGNYSMFMGIPYAQVNTSNPFGAAVPQTRFNDVFNAHDDSAKCPQIEEFNKTITGTVDCLQLNVYVPIMPDSKYRLPVLVWIHGGGFLMGFAGRYVHGPKYLVRHNIILVTVNYRLGPYGFMCLDTPEVPGNQGLKDQYLALKWVKNNIEAFGGDASQITVFGESAGGMSVDMHLMSPHEKLFDKIILQSGTSLLPPYNMSQIKDAPQKIASHLGFKTENVNKAITYLASVNTSLVIAAVSELNLQFFPCVEKKFEGVESFTNGNWFDQIAVPKVNNMPILIGYNKNESVFFYIHNNIENFKNAFRDRLSVSFDVDHSDFVDMERIVKQFYIGEEEISDHNIYKIICFDSDFTFIYPTYRSISKYLSNGGGNIYHYMFTYMGKRNFVNRRMNVTEGEAVHADELSYLFDMEIFEEAPTKDDQITIDRMTTMWSNFVKYGNPTPATSELLPVEWKPITKTSPHHYLEINADLTMHTSRPYNERISFWDLFYRSNEKLRKY
ncbi:hypothetical protein ACJJTC_011355 [Scirpophaga incertulas]